VKTYSAGSSLVLPGCANISDKDTRERELRPLRAIHDNYPKTVITYDRYVLDDIDGIRIVSIIDWLKE
jgi:hypothetical protein